MRDSVRVQIWLKYHMAGNNFYRVYIKQIYAGSVKIGDEARYTFKTVIFEKWRLNVSLIIQCA